MTSYTLSFDVVIYGGYTGNGVAEALAAVRESTWDRPLAVALVTEGKWVGGGLAQAFGKADIGNTGLQSSLYTDLMITGTGEWYGAIKAYDYDPHVAQSILMNALGAAGVMVYAENPLQSVQMTDTVIDSITTTYAGDTYVFQASIFIDASFEGDLMALATPEATISSLSGGWTVGTESAAAYSEDGAGFLRSPTTFNISPYISPGTLYPQVLPYPALSVGDAYAGIQNAVYRAAYSNQPSTKLVWRSPGDYDSATYALQTQITPVTGSFSPGGVSPGRFTGNADIVLVNTDASLGAVDTPLHWLYPNATYAQRRSIEDLIIDYQEGMYYFFANDVTRAGTYQDSIRLYGLTTDEFTGNSFWPYQLYFREGRRMIGQYVVTQQNTQDTNPAHARSTTNVNSVTVGGYSLDIHYGQYITKPGTTTQFYGEGTGQGAHVDADGYAIPYAAFLPQATYCTNLYVTYCASLSHVAWGSYRIFWTSFAAGEAVGCAAGICIQGSILPNDLTVTDLRAKLRDTYDFTVDPIWNNSTLYYVNARRQNKGNTYVCTQQGTSSSSGGGPTGTGTGIVDGSVKWDFTAT